MRLKKEPSFGHSYKLEHFHFEKLSLREKLLVSLSRLSGGGSLALAMLYHPARYLSPEPSAVREGLYSLISREVGVGEIEKVVKGGEVFLKITAEGEEWLERRYPILRFRNRKWDGLWRLVCFDIPEQERKRRETLRLKLRHLGFGMMQKSLWISPFNVAKAMRSFLRTHGLSDQVYVLEAKKLSSGNDRLLARRVWPLGRLSAVYEDWLAQAKKAKGGQRILELNEIFLQILKADPCLPEELLPEDWWGYPAYRKFIDLTKTPTIVGRFVRKN